MMRTLAVFILCLPLSFPSAAQSSIPKDELMARREKVFQKIGDGIGILWGAQSPNAPTRFNQAPDIYYLTGLEDPNAILLLIGKTKEVIFFSKKSTERDLRWNGPSAWTMADLKSSYGIDQLLSYEDFWDVLSQRSRTGTNYYLPMGPVDQIDKSRGDENNIELRLLRHPVKSIPLWKQSITEIKELFPLAILKNINPIMNELRQIKSPYEIEQLKMSGKIGVEGVEEAIKDTRPGLYEYELEAVAAFYYTKRGARGPAFAPIVASGPNTYTIHYEDNNRQINKEDFVLMDFGCNYNYYASDVTRVWPASGKFTEQEEKMYQCILDARNAIIKAMKPGVSFGELKATAYEVYKKHGYIDKELSWNGYIGHFTGMSVHDVGNRDDSTLLKSGMVFNVEPVLDDPINKRHMRLEDTVLITDTGAINLTEGSSAELTEIYKLMKQKGLTEN
jgi:Xaa-Pro aminopeptidase